MHECTPENLVRACHDFLARDLLKSLEQHVFARQLLSGVDVIKEQVLAVPRCRRLAARLLSLAKDTVVDGTKQWKTLMDLKKGDARAQSYVQLLLKAAPGLAVDLMAFGQSASCAMGHMKGGQVSACPPARLPVRQRSFCMSTTSVLFMCR